MFNICFAAWGQALLTESKRHLGGPKGQVWGWRVGRDSQVEAFVGRRAVCILQEEGLLLLAQIIPGSVSRLTSCLLCPRPTAEHLQQVWTRLMPILQVSIVEHITRGLALFLCLCKNLCSAPLSSSSIGAVSLCLGPKGQFQFSFAILTSRPLLEVWASV